MILVSVPVGAVEVGAGANALIHKQHLPVEDIILPEHVLMLIEEALLRGFAVVCRLYVDCVLIHTLAEAKEE